MFLGIHSDDDGILNLESNKSAELPDESTF